MDVIIEIRGLDQYIRKIHVTRMIFVTLNVVLATIVVMSDAAPNRTCPILSGQRQEEEKFNLTTEMFGVNNLEETIMQEDYEATYDVIALRTEQHQKGATVDDYKFLYDYLTGTGVHDFNETITIGFLGAYGTTQVVLGALPLAIAAVNRDPHLLPNRRLKFLAADIGTNIAAHKGRKDSSLAALAISAMTQMRDRGAVAFIGPDDTCSSEGLVAAAWNLPIISYKCAEAVVSDKQVYRTFARTLPPSSKVSKSVVALLKAFEWTQFAVVSGSRPAWGSNQMEAIKELATVHGLTITAQHQYSYYIPSHIADMERIVEATFSRTRVYVFLGEHIALVDFVSCLRRRRLLDNGEYIVISVDDQIYDPQRRHDIVQRTYLDPFLNGSQDLFAFRSVLKLTPSHPSNPNYREVCEHIKKLSAMPPFCVPNYHRIFDSISVPIEAAHLYDSVMIYARALTEALASGEDPRNGTALLNRILSRSYKSIQGYDVFIDASGDAEGNFTVVALLDDLQVNGSLRMSMQPVGYFSYGANSSGTLPEFLYLDPSRPIQWIGGQPPRAEPACGFFREKCERPLDWRLLAVTAFVGLTAIVAAVFLLKHYRYEQKLACLLWKIDLKDITIIPIETADSVARSKSVVFEKNETFYILNSALRFATHPECLDFILARRGQFAYFLHAADLLATPLVGCAVMMQSCRASLLLQGATQGTTEGGGGTQGRAYTQIALYRGNVVALKPVHKKSVDITRAIRKELKQIREVRHENLLQFIGACVENGHLAIVSPYCARGSLKDVLANRDLHLDGMFVSSLVSDLLKGMVYLHDSEIVSHGNLNSSNCLIDSRWVLQIADYGLHEFKAGQEEPDGALREERRALWKAPELLRSPAPPPRGTQKGDVYSFSIVLYEIIGRAGPWGHTDLSNAEILGRVRHPIDRVYFRPPLGPLTALGTAHYVLLCMEACWHEEPEQRPDIRFVRVRLKEMQQGLKPNIFDNMLAMMEKYAYNLEGLVAERTEQLTQEKKRTDQLLHRMLPKTVAEALKRGEPVQAESFNCVTIYFSDIVGFTEMSADSTPMQVVELLNDLYTCCDSIISHYDVYKVETIGDAYMVVSGLPLRNGDKHAGEIASMALHLLERVKRLEVRHRPGTRLKLRIGIHSGQCVAGVVGLKMPRYCLFGDTVNTASRMESAGEPLRIHVSAATVRLLRKLGGYQCTERGLTMIKGKGEMLTYWLEGEEPGRREARAIREISQTSLLASCSSDLATCDTPDLLRRPGLLAGIMNGGYPCNFRGRFSGPLRRCCPARSQELHPQGYGALPLPPVPCSCCGPPGRPHRSAPMVTFRDFDYEL